MANSINRVDRFISCRHDVLSEARNQDVERSIREDEAYFKITGENIARDPLPPEICVEDNSPSYSFQLANAAKEQRALKKKIEKSDALIKKRKARPKNAISNIDIEDNEDVITNFPPKKVSNPWTFFGD